MKKLLIVLFSILCCTSETFAQFSNAKSSSGISLLGEAKSWNGLRLSYGFHKDDYKYTYGSESLDLSELTFSYSHGFSVSRNVPLFLELAPEVSFIMGSQEVEYYESTYTQLSAGIPLNFGYQFNLTELISISPYIGLKAKINIIAKDKVEDSYYDDSYTINYFDEDEDWKRFQLCWQAGISFNLSQLHLGIGYYKDITPIAKLVDDISYKLFQSSFRITAGVSF